MQIVGGAFLEDFLSTFTARRIEKGTVLAAFNSTRIRAETGKFESQDAKRVP
jgi:hypothetical protein